MYIYDLHNKNSYETLTGVTRSNDDRFPSCVYFDVCALSPLCCLLNGSARTGDMLLRQTAWSGPVAQGKTAAFTRRDGHCVGDGGCTAGRERGSEGCRDASTEKEEEEVVVEEGGRGIVVKNTKGSRRDRSQISITLTLQVAMDQNKGLSFCCAYLILFLSPTQSILGHFIRAVCADRLLRTTAAVEIL